MLTPSGSDLDLKSSELLHYLRSVRVCGQHCFESLGIFLPIVSESEIHATDLRVQRKIQCVLGDVLGVELRVDNDRLHQDA